MAKFNLKDFWTNVKNQLTIKKSRKRAFVFIATMILTYIALACFVINFIVGEVLLGCITLGCFVAFFTLVQKSLRLNFAIVFYIITH